MRQDIGGKHASGGVHVERSTIGEVRRRRWSSLQDGQAGRGIASNESTRKRIVEVEVEVEVMWSYPRAARELDHKDSAERCPRLVSMV